MQRRDFLQDVVGTSVTAAAVSLPAARVWGANERVRFALIGCGGRGRFVAGHMRRIRHTELVTVCDVYEANAQSARSWAGDGCKMEHDFRRVLDDKSIDAVLIATPDHWHAIPAVLACQAGKDVYVEKPVAHNIVEGRAIVDAARRYERIVQAGTQQRSAPHFAVMRDIVQSGSLGKVRFVRIWNYRNIYPRGIGKLDDAAPPDGLDWDFYLGPAPSVPFNRNRFLGSFRWFFDYAGGIATDWGTHRFDSMHQVMGVDQPQSVAATGGRFDLDDGGDVPDVLQVTYQYPGFVVSYEANALNAHGMGGRTPGRPYYRMNGNLDRPNGLAFYGTNGTLFADRLGFEVYPELKLGAATHRLAAGEITPDVYRMQPQDGQSGDSTFDHCANFIECVRTRTRPVADIETGHRASLVAHLGNIAYRSGEKLIWNADRESFEGGQHASHLLSRDARKPWNLL